MLLKLLEMLNNDLTVELMSLCLDRLDRWNRFIHFIITESIHQTGGIGTAQLLYYSTD